MRARIPDVVEADRPRVLFIAEAVTLAHPARAFALARAVNGRRFERVVATDPRFSALFPGPAWQSETIRSISTEHFLTALAKGSQIYDLATMRGYIEEDLALMRRTRPAVVIGDFRLSLSISARILSIPYINVTNAYWSRYAEQQWCVPSLPWVKYMGVPAANLLFRSTRKMAFAAQMRPMETLCAEYGFPSYGHDPLRLYSDGDICMYADVPELVPIFNAPPSHRYLGPVAWSPPVPLPRWWSELEPDDKFIYVNLGSSGDHSRLAAIVEAVAGLGRTVIVAAAGAAYSGSTRPNVRNTSYLPGDMVAKRSALVVCNGGSLASYQALAEGVPVLAFPSNLDQVLNSGYLKASKVGDWLRPESAGASAIRKKAGGMLDDANMRRAAQAMSCSIGQTDPAMRLEAAVDELRAVVPTRSANAR